jgi:ATP-dependent helicase HrpA
LNPNTPDLLAATLAADHPKIAALAATVAERVRAGRPCDREKALLEALLDRSRKAFAARAARLPTPRFPDELPIAQKREEIAALVAKHPVTIVCGETGSGKTTQLPKICLELGRGVGRAIGHTQPRRIAARTVASRIAQELRASARELRRLQGPLPGRR